MHVHRLIMQPTCWFCFSTRNDGKRKFALSAVMDRRRVTTNFAALDELSFIAFGFFDVYTDVNGHKNTIGVSSVRSECKQLAMITYELHKVGNHITQNVTKSQSLRKLNISTTSC